jgi:hypothetical protein
MSFVDAATALASGRVGQPVSSSVQSHRAGRPGKPGAG